MVDSEVKDIKDTIRRTSINALCRNRSLVESGHEAGDKIYG